MNGQAGKGDSYRPVNRAAYDENYDRIFRKGSNAPAPDDQAAEVQYCPCCGHDTRRVNGLCSVCDYPGV